MLGENKMKTKFIRNNRNFPALLYKNFTSSEDLENFKNGNILIRRIEYHKKWEKENKRLDTTENQANYTYEIEGMTINGRLTYVNPVYILSMSGPFSRRCKCRNNFGVHEIKVINPEEFNATLKNTWANHPLSSSFEVFHVEYSKGEKREVPENILEPHGLSLYQKDKIYSDEEEYRFIFYCSMNSDIEFPEVLMLNIDYSTKNLLFE